MSSFKLRDLGTGSPSFKIIFELGITGACLGTFERFRVVLHDLGFHHNVAIVGRFSGPATSLDEPKLLIYSALRQAIYHHPALSVMVAGTDTVKPYFMHIDKIDLQRVVTFDSMALGGQKKIRNWDETLSKNHGIGFDNPELPLWRVIVLADPETEQNTVVDIAFIWHHVIGDGRSGVAVLSTIWQGINSAHCGNGKDQASSVDTNIDATVDSIVRPQVKTMLPALEEILPMTMAPMTLLKHWFSRWVLVWFLKPAREETWTGGLYTCEKPVVTKIRQISIPASSVKRLVTRCRKEKTTMTPLLQTVAGEVILDTVANAKLLRCATAISLRRFFPASWNIDDTVMGLWVSVFHTDNVRVVGESGNLKAGFWDSVRKNSQRIQYEIAKGQEDIEIGMLRYIDDFKVSLLTKMGKQRENSFGITNLGMFPTQPRAADGSSSPAPWVISDLLFSQSCHVNGSAIQFCIVSVEGGDMNIALSWQEGIVSAADAARIGDQLRSHLIALGDE